MRSRTSMLRGLSVVVGVIALIASGCGGDDDESGAGSISRVGLAVVGVTAELTADIVLDDGPAAVSIDWGDGFREAGRTQSDLPQQAAIGQRTTAGREPGRRRGKDR